MAEGCKTYSSTSVELFSLLLVLKSKPRIFFFIILLSGYCGYNVFFMIFILQVQRYKKYLRCANSGGYFLEIPEYPDR